MNIKEFKREISLHKLGISELEGDAQKIYNFLMEKLSGLNIYENIKHQHYISFGKTVGTIVFEYNYFKNRAYVRNSIWYFFEDEVHMKDRDIEELMKWWVQSTLNFKPKVIQESFFMLVDDF